MKIFLSADIEGTAGVMDWDETEKGERYERARMQMTREVAAACNGAIDAGATELLVKDAHHNCTNIDPEQLPECARLYRGWSRHPFSMMYGLDKSFDGVFLTGCHSAAGSDANPLSHTMTTNVQRVTINGEIASEMVINGLTAAYVGVPVYLVTGDRGLCESVKMYNPNTATVAVSDGSGSGSFSLQPHLAAKRIRAAAAQALKMPAASCMFALPQSFVVEIEYRKHFDARRFGFYPGCIQTNACTVRFESTDYFDVLTFFAFCL